MQQARDPKSKGSKFRHWGRLTCEVGSTTWHPQVMLQKVIVALLATAALAVQIGTALAEKIDNQPRCEAAGMSGWLCAQAASGARTWYAPFCDSGKIQTLGRASKNAMQGEFTFDPSATSEQREYIEHWRGLAAHCMQSPDNSCKESWKLPCAPSCDGPACTPSS
jgi:hypothetical protein